jgi:hypothetical protein
MRGLSSVFCQVQPWEKTRRSYCRITLAGSIRLTPILVVRMRDSGRQAAEENGLYLVRYSNFAARFIVMFRNAR